jgi:transcriptional regulator with XRE-family HTH domain
MPKSTHTAEYAALCAELRAARLRAKLSQRQLAAVLKVPHSWIAKVETAERRIDVIEFTRFLAACGDDATGIFDTIARQVTRPARAGRGGRR